MSERLSLENDSNENGLNGISAMLSLEWYTHHYHIASNRVLPQAEVGLVQRPGAWRLSSPIVQRPRITCKAGSLTSHMWKTKRRSLATATHSPHLCPCSLLLLGRAEAHDNSLYAHICTCSCHDGKTWGQLHNDFSSSRLTHRQKLTKAPVPIWGLPCVEAA